MEKKISCRNNIKLFNRYLKERGLFTEFWREAKRQEGQLPLPKVRGLCKER